MASAMRAASASLSRVAAMQITSCTPRPPGRGNARHCTSGSVPATDDEKQAAFPAKTPYPSELREPGFEHPVVLGGHEQILGFVAEHDARIASNEVDVVFREPPLDFAQRVPMLLRMLVLVAQP